MVPSGQVGVGGGRLTSYGGDVRVYVEGFYGVLRLLGLSQRF